MTFHPDASNQPVSERGAVLSRQGLRGFMSRSGHHLPLHYYQNRIHPEVNPFCSWCGQEEEMVPHLSTACPGVAEGRWVAGFTPR